MYVCMHIFIYLFMYESACVRVFNNYSARLVKAISKIFKL